MNKKILFGIIAASILIVAVGFRVFLYTKPSPLRLVSQISYRVPADDRTIGKFCVENVGDVPIKLEGAYAYDEMNNIYDLYVYRKKDLLVVTLPDVVYPREKTTYIFHIDSSSSEVQKYRIKVWTPTEEYVDFKLSPQVLSVKVLEASFDYFIGSNNLTSWEDTHDVYEQAIEQALNMTFHFVLKNDGTTDLENVVVESGWFVMRGPMDGPGAPASYFVYIGQVGSFNLSIGESKTIDSLKALPWAPQYNEPLLPLNQSLLSIEATLKIPNDVETVRINVSISKTQ